MNNQQFFEGSAKVTEIVSLIFRASGNLEDKDLQKDVRKACGIIYAENNRSQQAYNKFLGAKIPKTSKYPKLKEIVNHSAPKNSLVDLKDQLIEVDSLIDKMKNDKIHTGFGEIWKKEDIDIARFVRMDEALVVISSVIDAIEE